MTTVQNVNSTNYKYENIEAIEKTQEVQEVQLEVQEDSLKTQVQVSNSQAQVNPVSTEEVLEKHLIETQEYSQKIKEKIMITNLPEENKYIEIALELKKTIENLIGVITEEDVKKVLQENYNPAKLSIDMLAKVIDQNKVAFKINDFEKLKTEVEEQVEIFKARFADVDALKQTINSLKENNLPVDRRNIEKVQQVLTKANDIKIISNQTIVNILKQDKELTIENVYKAKYMGERTKESSEADSLKELESQIKVLLKSESIKATKENIELCKMLIKNNVPLDHNTFEKIKVLKEDISKLEKEDIIVKAIENYANNKSLGKIFIHKEIETPKLIDDTLLEKIVKQIHEIEASHIEKVIRNDQEINLERLFKVMETKPEEEPIVTKTKAAIKAEVRKDTTIEVKNDANQTNKQNTSVQSLEKTAPTEALNTKEQLRIIKATLNLEEIRLKMTLEAASRMLEKGINIEVEPLEEIVKELKQLEREVYAKHLTLNSVEPTTDHINKVEEVYEKVGLMREMSPKVMIKVMTREIDFTIKEMGNEARNELVQEKAQQSYQLLGTKPRRDLGDSVEKTFSQIEGILEELELEPTKNNIKATKILAKNEMPITIDNIEAVKLIDMKVVEVTEKLHPSIVVNMIKDQLSPIDMHVDEVLQYMTEFEVKLGITPDEQIAKAIHELDNSKELTKEERESLIGIYRMFTTVSKSKGEAVGFLIKNNLPLSLTNLFEAAKYIKSTRGEQNLIKVDIDDDFGILSEVKYEGKNIKEQIGTAIHRDNLVATKNLMNLIEGLEKAGLNVDASNLQTAAVNDKILETFLDTASYEKIITLYKDGLMKEENVSIEKLIEHINATESKGKEFLDLEDVLNQVKALSQIEVDTLKNFEKYGLNKSLPNLFTANEVEKNPFELLNKLEELLKTLDTLPIDTSELRDTLLRNKEIDPIKDYEETLTKVKEQLSKLQVDLLETQVVDKGTINKSINQTIQLVDYQKALHNGDEYYQIPMMIGGKITQMNLYYFKDNKPQKSDADQSSMNIYLFFHTDNIGKVQANIRLDNNKMDFSIYANDPGDMELVKTFGNKIKTLLNSTEFSVENINYGFFEAKSPIQEGIKEMKKEKLNKHADSRFETII